MLGARRLINYVFFFFSFFPFFVVFEIRSSLRTRLFLLVVDFGNTSTLDGACMAVSIYLDFYFFISIFILFYFFRYELINLIFALVWIRSVRVRLSSRISSVYKV